MGTFHENKGQLHGITVVVDTSGPQIWVGRCDEVAPEGVILLDADVHEEGDGGQSKSDWLAKAAQYGVFKKYDRVTVPTDQVASIRRLGEISP